MATKLVFLKSVNWALALHAVTDLPLPKTPEAVILPPKKYQDWGMSVGSGTRITTSDTYPTIIGRSSDGARRLPNLWLGIGNGRPRPGSIPGRRLLVFERGLHSVTRLAI
jgi:hypothetical protein